MSSYIQANRNTLYVAKQLNRALYYLEMTHTEGDFHKLLNHILDNEELVLDENNNIE